jgi:hypothetical protein
MPTPPEPQRPLGELPRETLETDSPTPAVPISARNATTGGTSGIATPNLPNPEPQSGDERRAGRGVSFFALAGWRCENETNDNTSYVNFIACYFPPGEPRTSAISMW